MSLEPWMVAWPRKAIIPPPLPPRRVLRPAHRVAEGARALAARVVTQRPGHLEEQVLGHAADARDDRGRVAREVPLEHLEDAARVLERLVVGRLGDVLAPHLAVASRARLGEDLLVARGGHHSVQALVLPGVGLVLA